MFWIICVICDKIRDIRDKKKHRQNQGDAC